MTASAEQLAFAAIAHILQRVYTDSNFAWLMLHTESLALCCQAMAAKNHEDPDAVKARANRIGTDQINRDLPIVKQHEITIQQLQTKLSFGAEMQEEILLDATAAALEPLLNYCRLRGEQPTIEAIEAALSGHDLGCVLQHMPTLV